LLGNYRVVEQLGEGGMGVVYVGSHETLGRRVVVKVLKRELSAKADMVRRFFNEAQATTAIHHPGIVQVFDFGTTPDGRAYFVMELLEGQTLAARLERRRLEDVECCRIGRQVANVLQATHAAGITHRDLKPDNLFLVPDPEVPGGERVKVLDFGIAKLAGETQVSGVKTRTGAIMGTPVYMSPEQCRGAGAVDARSDIYSLGCILFEMACGRPPFVGEGAGEIVGAHLHVPPPAPQDLAPGMSPELANLIARMLAKRPEARPQTMAAVGQALDEILAGLEGAPRRAPTHGPARVRVHTPVTQLAPASTTLSSSAGTASMRAAGPARRRMFAIGGIVVAGAAAGALVAIAIPGSGPGSSSSGSPPATAAPEAKLPPEVAEAGPASPPATVTPTLPPTPPAAPASTPPAPPAATTPTPPAPPEPPADVEVAIDSTPPGASVLLAGSVLGKTPFRGTLPHGERDMTLVVRLRGYSDRTIVVRPDQPISKSIKLVAIPKVQPPRNRDYSVNPFSQ